MQIDLDPREYRVTKEVAERAKVPFWGEGWKPALAYLAAWVFGFLVIRYFLG
jgi:hypothetical protein